MLYCILREQNNSPGLQSSLLVVDCRFGSILSSAQLKKVLRKPIRNVTIHFEDRRNAASLRHKNQYEIDVLCVNGSPIRYVFGDGTRAIRFSFTRGLVYSVIAAE